MALANSYDGIIFDYGGVLVTHQSDEDQARMAEIAAVPKDLFTELYWSDRLDYDKALVSAFEYWQAIAQRAGTVLKQQAIDQLIELDTVSWMHFDSVMWDWIDQLRRSRKRVAMLSNMPRELGEALKSRTERLNNFDFVTLSYEVHSVKPEPAIYEQCLEGLGLEAGQTLFFDDKMANIQGPNCLECVPFSLRIAMTFSSACALNAIDELAQTGSVSSAPPEEIASSSAVWRLASEPSALPDCVGASERPSL